MPKVTFMGAGSTVFAKNILGDCMCTEALRDAHLALYDRSRQEIQMHLRATRDLKVKIRQLGISIQMEKGETIRTEISRKFTRASVEALVQEAALKIADWHTDSKGWFSHAVIVGADNP